MDITVASRISQSQVVSRTKNGRLAAAMMSDKKKVYKTRNLPFKDSNKRVNVKRRRADANEELWYISITVIKSLIALN